MIRPLPGYVLVEPLKEEEKTVGGVYLPENSKDKPSKGKVISIGGPILADGKQLLHGKDGIKQEENGFMFYQPQITVDQVVLYKKWTNQEVTDEGKEYLLVKFDELLGVLE